MTRQKWCIVQQENVNNAILFYGGNVSKRPRIVICSIEEIGNVLGKYDEMTDTLYLIPQIGDKKSVRVLDTLDTNIEFGYTEAHEIWHWMRTQIYGRPIDDITEYNRWLNKKAKNRVAKLGINEYNVKNISGYAFDNYIAEKYYEVEAEYMSMLFVKRK